MHENWPRKIIHMDMDAFFASVEQRDHPEYRGKPVIVGGTPFGRGVVSTASYEARKFGVHSAMPASQARRLCPQGIFLKPHFEKYQIESHKIMSVLGQYTDLVETVSLDEAYLDVTCNRLKIEDPAMLASMIKQNIFAVTQLTASAGVAPNMFLAKVASDFKKPDGLTVIDPEAVEEFLNPLPVRKIPGVGPVTEAQLAKYNIHTCGELAAKNSSFLYEKFGKVGLFLSERAQGIDDREIEPEREPKQYSTEETFAEDVRHVEWLKAKLKDYAEEIFAALKQSRRMGRTVVLKVKYFDFEQITRSYTFKQTPLNGREIYDKACHLLESKTLAGKKPIRLIGLGISGLHQKAELAPQQDLFELPFES